MTVETEDFFGKGRFSAVRWQEIRDFAERLATFPITKAAPVAVQWGHGGQDSDNLIIQIEIAATDNRGGLVARCEVADEVEESAGVTRARVKARFLTSYVKLDTFRNSIVLLLSNEIDAAVLTGR